MKLKCQHLEERIKISNAKTSSDAPEFDAYFELAKRDEKIQAHTNTIRKLNDAIVGACFLTNRSQELLEYAIGTCPKIDSKQDRSSASSSNSTNKHVTFAGPLETSDPNTSKHVQQLEVKKTKVPITPSTGVNSVTNASKSKPRSNMKDYRTSLAKSVPKTKVEDHMRNYKSELNKRNHNSNPNSLCKTCNKCLILSNHDKCVEKFLKSFNKPPVKKVWRAKQIKQIWKATGKLFANVGYQWKPTGRKFTLGEQCPLTRITNSNVVPIKELKPTGRTFPLETQCPLPRPIASTSEISTIETNAPKVLVAPELVCTNQLKPNSNWGSDTPNLLLSSVFKCRSYISSFGIWTQAAQNI